MNDVFTKAEQLGLRSKLRKMADRSIRGGNVISRGQLHHILTNPIYARRIRHKGQVFEGQHPSLIEPSRWDQVQVKLSDKAQVARTTEHHRETSPLAGKLFDQEGKKLTPSHTKKGNHRYRYYVSRRLMAGGCASIEKHRTWRIPAPMLEQAISSAVRDHLAAAKAKRNIFDDNTALSDVAALDLVEQVRIAPDSLEITLCNDQLDQTIGAKQRDIGKKYRETTLPFTERRRGVEMKMVIGDSDAEIYEALLRNVAQANQWHQKLKTGQSFEQIASETNTSKRRVQQIVELAFLAPDIVRDIIKGTQPMGLTSNWCIRHTLPADWQAQRQRISTL